jgi:hypothetical protein
VLGALKSNQEPRPLPVHECVVTEGGEVYARLSR